MGYATSKDRDQVKTESDFIWQVPGEDAEIDAYNLVLATITRHPLWFDSVIDHQRDTEQMGNILAVVLAWLELAYAALKPMEREMMLAGYRSVAAKNVDRDKPRNWLSWPVVRIAEGQSGAVPFAAGCTVTARGFAFQLTAATLHPTTHLTFSFARASDSSTDFRLSGFQKLPPVLDGPGGGVATLVAIKSGCGNPVMSCNVSTSQNGIAGISSADYPV